MQDYTKFEALVESLRESLNNCQYENFGRPYNKDAQFAFGNNWYGTMTDFWKEFKSSLPALPKKEQKLYCNEVYYEIAWYVILFDHLKDDYERKLSGSGRAKLSEATYNLVLAYSTAIRDYLRLIREAAKLRGIALLLPNELTLESYRPGGSFIQPNVLDVEDVEEEHLGQVAVTSTPLTSALTIDKAFSGVGGETTEQLPHVAFVDLFINPADIEPCLQALRNYRPEKPILGEGLTWTGSIKDRGLIVAWIERMETISPKKIDKLTDRKELVRVLNSYFDGLCMGKDASVFAKVVDAPVRDKFIALIPQ